MAQGGDACLREDVASSTGHLRLSSGAELTVIYCSTSTRSRVTRARRADQHREASRRTVDALRMTRNPRAHLRWPISGPQLGWESAVAGNALPRTHAAETKGHVRPGSGRPLSSSVGNFVGPFLTSAVTRRESGMQLRGRPHWGIPKREPMGNLP